MSDPKALDLDALRRLADERRQDEASEAPAPSVNPRGDGSDAGCDGNRARGRE